MTTTLLPLYPHPPTDPAPWRATVAAAAAAGAGLTVVVDWRGRERRWWGAVLARLASYGTTVLGRVDAGFATRPVPDLLEDIEGWDGCPVAGIFLDRAPTSAYGLGPVALAGRTVRRMGLRQLVLNPGVPTDPLYRELGAAVCSFEGAWPEYRRWSGEGAQPGDGHLVHSVPAEELPRAWSLLRRRRAGFGLVTDATPPRPYARPPARLPGAGAPAGNGDRSGTSGW